MPGRPADEADIDIGEAAAEPVVAEPGLSEPGPAEAVDTLPPELDVTGYVGPYVFPNNSRRRMPGALYVFLGVVAIATWAVTLRSDPNIVNEGFLAGGIALLLLGGYHFWAGWDLRVDERDALMAAVREVGFPVGHASAQMGWRGWASRPTWRILAYSNEVRPLRRALVLIDGVDGQVLETIVEDNPEDWSDVGAGAAASAG